MSVFFQNLEARKPKNVSWNRWTKETLHVSYPTYLIWKRGGEPRWSTVERIAEILGCRPTELMESAHENNTAI